MRNTTSSQLEALNSPYRASSVDVQVWFDGAWLSLRDLEDWDWIESVRVIRNVDQSISSVELTAKRRVEKLSLVPFDDDSKINRAGAVIDVGVLIRVMAAVTGQDVEPCDNDWEEILLGYIDEVNWGSDPMTIRGRDRASQLADRWIEQQLVFPASETGTVRAEHLIQDIIDDTDAENLDTLSADYTWSGTTTVTTSDTSEVEVGDFIGYQRAPLFKIASIVPNTSVTITNPESQRTIPTGSGGGSTVKIPAADRWTLYSETGDASTPFKNADSPGWLIRTYLQRKMHCLEAVRVISNQIGWELRYVWHNPTDSHELVFYEPPRGKTTPDAEFTQDFYHRINNLNVRRHTVRNVTIGTYIDGTTNVPVEVKKEDAASIAKYGRRTMEIVEGSNSQIDSSSEMNMLLQAALDDLKEPTAEKSVTLPFYWAAQIADLYRFKANGVHYTSDQDLAVVSIVHTLKADQARTDLELRGKPAGGFKRWLQIEARLGIGPPADARQDNAPQNLATEVGVATLVVTYDDPRSWDVEPKIEDWLTTECHVSDTSGFTPSASTLRAIARTTRFEIDGLLPGVTYYVKLVSIDGNGNRSQISQEVVATTQKVGPYHRNQEEEWGTLNQNPTFGVFTLPYQTNPPDFWSVDPSSYGIWDPTVVPGSGNFGRRTDISLTGGLSIQMASLDSPGNVFNFWQSDLFVVEEDILIVLEFAWRHNGDGGNNVNWLPYFQFYDISKTILPGIFGLTDTAFAYNYMIGLPSNTWFKDRGWITTPATAKYGQIVFRVNAIAAQQARHPQLAWDKGACSRALVKLIQEGGGTSRSFGSGTWTAPYFTAGPLIDNANGFTNGAPTPILIEHDYTIPFDGQYTINAQSALLSLNNGRSMSSRLRVVPPGGPTSYIEGSSIQYNNQRIPAAPVFANQNFSAGTTIRLEAYHNGTGGRTFDMANTFLNIDQITNVNA